jgi:hypothetical protein
MCVRIPTERVARNRRHDAKRAANPHRKLYQTPQWKWIRKLKLSINPICEVCRTARAEVVHHRDRAALHPDRFFHLPSLQSACKRCHDSTLQSEESIGYSAALGTDGYPVDERHPFYRGN